NSSTGPVGGSDATQASRKAIDLTIASGRSSSTRSVSRRDVKSDSVMGRTSIAWGLKASPVADRRRRTGPRFRLTSETHRSAERPGSAVVDPAGLCSTEETAGAAGRCGVLVRRSGGPAAGNADRIFRRHRAPVKDEPGNAEAQQPGPLAGLYF